MSLSVLAAYDPPSLGVTPHIILGIYLVGLLALGIIGLLKGRKAKNAEDDYYLASRGQGVIVTSLTIMATYFSGVAMLGFPGLVYASGIAPMLMALNLPVAAGAIYILGNRIRRIGTKRGYITPADMVTDYYGQSQLIRIVIAIAGALYVIPYVIIQIKAGGFLAKGLFPDVEPFHLLGLKITMEHAGIGALSIVTMVYVIIGGMRSVAWTDVIQGFLLLSAMLLSGIAIMSALGGVGGYFESVGKLSEDQGKFLVVPDAPTKFNITHVFTFCLFASLASILQPAQWMRFYAARDSKTLRTSAIAFATILPICFIFGVFLVGLGGRVLPAETFPTEWTQDEVVIHVIRDQFPVIFGGFGVLLVSIILVAVMAASMSTADSNLHALSAVVTRDVYSPLNPKSSNAQRAWVGRIVIIAATVVATGVTYAGEGLFSTIQAFFFLAMGFSAQLLPITLDLLFLRKGSKAGALAGLIAGILTVALFPPLGALILGEANSLVEATSHWKARLDVGFCGIVVNVIVFVLVSLVTKKPDATHREAFAKDLAKS